MSESTKNIFILVGLVVGVYIAWHVAVALLPWAIVAAVIYGVYQLFGRKALGGGRRTLP